MLNACIFSTFWTPIWGHLGPKVWAVWSVWTGTVWILPAVPQGASIVKYVVLLHHPLLISDLTNLMFVESVSSQTWSTAHTLEACLVSIMRTNAQRPDWEQSSQRGVGDLNVAPSHSSLHLHPPLFRERRISAQALILLGLILLFGLPYRYVYLLSVSSLFFLFLKRVSVSY